MKKKLIELKNITKKYGTQTLMENLNLYICENEFITLLGPSGCGKTTILRMIGGFLDATSGDIILDGIKINDIPAHLRPINTVFQKYALFPHLNVFDNIAFGLRNFNRTISDIKTNVSLNFENEKKNLQLKLVDKKTTKEEKKEIKLRLKEIKNEIKQIVNERKNDLIEKLLLEVENKYNPLIEKIDQEIDIEWEKDDIVKDARKRIKEIDEIILNDPKEKKKYESELKQLKSIASWEELDKLETKRKELLKNKSLEIKSAKSLMKNKIQIEEAVKDALKLVGLEGFENRMINQMSGGQQQRVAIARAIVNKPRILLLDEPLAALDLKLRKQMQYELKEMQKRLGITFVFVTHDQEEALSMSDTIVVMDHGKIEQIGTPEDIYNEPKNRFVANFIGETNIFSGKYIKPGIVNFLGNNFKCVDMNFSENEIVDVVIRPEDFDIVDLNHAKIIGEVTNVIFKGIHFEITAKIDNEFISIRKYELFKVGDKIGLDVDSHEIHLMKVENENI